MLGSPSDGEGKWNKLTAEEIIVEHLRKFHFDGLYLKPSGLCHCKIGGLGEHCIKDMPSSGGLLDCVPWRYESGTATFDERSPSE